LKASTLAQHVDYAGAIAVLNAFSGNLGDYPAITEKIEQYTAAQSELVLWDDPNKVLNLSFHMLIANPERAFTDPTFGSSYRNNFVTKTEFTKILQQLYDNGYILVSLKDITSANGPKELYLPEGKKPLILTQTNVNYYTYMIDSDGDKLPDKDGDGFASKLIIDANGNITCEMVDSNGETVTGAYDLIPILDAFVETHPDFSYKGAKAIIAVSGYDGILGYRTTSAAQEFFGKAFYGQEVQQAKAVVSKLRDSGYELACYTYSNEPYGNFTTAQIENELTIWKNEVTPILGETDIFVFSSNSDIANGSIAYSGEKFETLKDAGYLYYLGFSTDETSWYYSNGDYIRQGRIMVTGSNLRNHPEWFDSMFDVSKILDPAR
jgi:hypothetical protein